MMQIDLQGEIENKFNKILNYYNGDYNALFTNSINYYISELQKGIKNIELDLSHFENKYSMSSKDFFTKFENGEYEDKNDDFLQWSGEYEIFLESERKLQDLL